VIALLLSWALLVQAVAPSPLVGRWDAETRSSSGLGIWFELADQGACSQTVGVMVDGTWKLDGEGLTLSVPVPSGPPAVQHGSVSFDGPMLTQAFEGTPKLMLREGPSPAAASLAGVWTYPYPTGGTAYEEYTPDGRLLFRLPIKTTSCQWTVDADRLVLTLGTDSVTSRWRIADDRLTMIVNGQSRAYRRERAGAIPPAASAK
jgi:hypothetical protein